MKLKILSTLLIVISCMAGCRKLDVPPVNIVQDKDIFASPNGVQAYMARIYSEMPIEDFRFSPTRGFNFSGSSAPSVASPVKVSVAISATTARPTTIGLPPIR